jgi:hypothetical protein
MFRKSQLFVFLVSAFVTVPVLTLAASREIIPSGTLLQCTVSEPNFSQKTAQVGDPILCHLGAFGHSVFPRGAELGGHLEDAKSPGHFVGKGWLQVEFDRMILPGAEILPLSAKVVSTPHMKVDAEGKIHGKGHPVRDAVEWTIPIFWPIKIITLPARGPYPALKGETRLSLRLMEDVEVPIAVAHNVPMPPWASPSSYHASSYQVFRQASATLIEPEVTVQRNDYRQPLVPPQVTGQPPAQTGTQTAEPTLTVLALTGGQAYLAREYWVQGGEVHCLLAEGEQKTFPLDKMDLYQTATLNRQRNIRFVLQSKDVVEQ